MNKYVNIIGLAFVWGGLYAAQGYANKNVNSFAAGTVIFLVTMFLFSITIFSKGLMSDLKKAKIFWKNLVLIGLIGFSINLTNFIAFQLGSAQTGAFLLKTDILMVNFVSMLFYKEKFSKMDWLYTITMLTGVFMILGINPVNLTFSLGDTLFLISAILLTWNTFNIKNLVSQAKIPINGMTVAIYNGFITMCLFITMTFGLKKTSDFSVIFSRKDVLIALLISGILQYLLYLMYYKSLAELPAWLVKVILLLIPVITLVITTIIFDTIPSKLALMGCTVVLISAFGIIYEQRVKQQKNLKIKTV